MRIPIGVALFVAGAMLPSFCSATSIQIPLPGLTGAYEADEMIEPNFGYAYTREATFEVPSDVVSIDGLTLVISGEWHDGEMSCTTYSGGVERTPLPGPLALHVVVEHGSPSKFFHARIEVPSGTFSELAVPFESCCPSGTVDYDELIGAAFDAEMFVDAGFVGNCWLSQDTYGELTEVRVDLDGSVPIEQSTWSSVKGLYE